MTFSTTLARLRAVVRESAPVLVMLAGSNGAGKTTLYRTRLAAIGLPFVNADEIAHAIQVGSRTLPPRWSDLALDSAAQKMADIERDTKITLAESFITETVFSDPVGAKLQMLDRAKAQGFYTMLIFVGISDPALSEARVLERVASRGGHDVPRERIYARFPRTLENLERAIPIADRVVLLDNDDDRKPYRLIARFEHGRASWRARSLPGWLPRSVATALARLDRTPKRK